jgi:RNA polymerase sigma-70 factor (ECF subfamily)
MGHGDAVAASRGAEEPAGSVTSRPRETWGDSRREEAAVGSPGSAEEQGLLEALRRGDEAAFVALVERYQGRLLRLALLYVPNRAVAEEVVQDTWQGVLVGLDRFEGRAPLRAWIYRILLNTAKSRGRRERWAAPFSALAGDDAAGEAGEPAVEPERFRAADPWQGHWISVPDNWNEVPEERLLAEETRAEVQRAIQALPPTQRAVITLRDVEQCPPEEVCALLGLSEGNQRVLLHRARSKVRRALEAYLGHTTA